MHNGIVSISHLPESDLFLEEARVEILVPIVQLSIRYSQILHLQGSMENCGKRIKTYTRKLKLFHVLLDGFLPVGIFLPFDISMPSWKFLV